MYRAFSSILPQIGSQAWTTYQTILYSQSVCLSVFVNWFKYCLQRGQHSSNQTSLQLHSNSGNVGLGGSVMLLLLQFQDLFLFDVAHTSTQTSWQAYTHAITQIHNASCNTQHNPLTNLKQPFSPAKCNKRLPPFQCLQAKPFLPVL